MAPICDISATFRHRVHRRLNGREPPADHLAHVRVSKNIELVVADRRQHARSDACRIDAGLDVPGNLSGNLAGPAFRIERLRLTITRRPVAAAIVDAGADEMRTEHADADAFGLELRREPF